MADLEALIRLRRHTVEEKQKILADILRQIEALEARKQDLIDKLAIERKALDENFNLETREYFGRFQDVVNNNIEKLTNQILGFEGQLQEAQEAVREAFADMKRVQIVDDRRKEDERQELNDKESAELDAIGIEGFRRKEEF